MLERLRRGLWKLLGDEREVSRFKEKSECRIWLNCKLIINDEEQIKKLFIDKSIKKSDKIKYWLVNIAACIINFKITSDIFERVIYKILRAKLLIENKHKPIKIKEIKLSRTGKGDNYMKVMVNVEIESYDKLFELLEEVVSKKNNSITPIIIPAIKTLQKDVSKEILNKLLLDYLGSASEELCNFVNKKVDGKGLPLKISDLQVCEDIVK